MRASEVLSAVIATVIVVAGSISPVAAQDTLFAILSGASVCNTPPNADPPLCRLGDPDGVGSATVLITGPTSLCAAIVVNRTYLMPSAGPVGAHIHVGQPSYSGPVLVQLPTPNANGGGNPGTSMACKADVPANVISAIQANPQYYYIDVHGQGLQFGALRGQLF